MEKIKAIVGSCGTALPPVAGCTKEKLQIKGLSTFRNRENIDLDVQEHLIVELYSK